MPGNQWTLGLFLLGTLLVHLLVTYRTYRRRAADAPGGDDAETGDADPIDLDAGVVECRKCGADNDLGYRFCRSCVTELPQSMDFAGNDDSPLGRFAG